MWSLATMETLSSPSEKETEAKSSAEAAKRESEEAGRESVVAKVARERKDCNKKVFQVIVLNRKFVMCTHAVFLHFPVEDGHDVRVEVVAKVELQSVSAQMNEIMPWLFFFILEKVTIIAHRVLMSGSSMQGKAALAPVLPKSDASSTLVSPEVSSVNSVLKERKLL